ncbi:MAG: hypothetical protein M3480_06920, partial [Verrucomicrobiota bacterium]|nr:hypothetical protein [Verrucomicrobiota bacterium]
MGVSSFSGVGVGDALGLRFAFGEGLGVGLLFFRVRLARRGLGVGVGVEKIFLIFSPNDGSAARAGEAGASRNAIRPADNHLVRRGGLILVAQLQRRFPDFLENRLVHLDPDFQVFDREVFVRRMGSAIGQGQPE